MPAGEIPQRIHRLPGYLVNQIAAGEVIERPASVVKELLENSLDAGASIINIDIERGGSRLIRVVDNGHGIHPDDLLLAVDTHTTSKLYNAEGLWRITTLGFRGEALSSIASVSRLSLTSRQNPDTYGHTLHSVAGADISPVQPAPHPVGTTVEVRDLFYNTPARRKFLRSERTEFIHIHELIKRIALSRFGICLRLTHNSRQVLSLPDASSHPAARVAAVTGRTFLDQSLRVNQELGDMNLRGWIGLPAAARSQNDQQYFYLNGRNVRDKLINHAVRLASQDQLYPGRHPVYVLYLEMDAAAADINVHPAKQEVRFRDARAVHDFIYGSVARAISTQTPGPGRSKTEIMAGNFQVSDNKTSYHYKADRVPAGTVPLPAPSFITLSGRYLLTENNHQLMLVDVYLARKLILHRRLTKSFAAGEIPGRPVLVPLGLTVTNTEIELIEAQQSLLQKYGLELQAAGPARILIRTLPVALAGADAAELVRDVIAVLKMQNADNNQTDVLFQTLSSHANDSAPLALMSSEMSGLLADLMTIREHISEPEFMKVCRCFELSEIPALLHMK